MARPYVKIGTSTLQDIPKRDEYSFLLEFTDDEDAPVDISGWSFVTTLKRDALPDDPTDSNAAARRIDTAPPGSTNGEFTIVLSGGDGGDTDILPAEYVLTCRRILGLTNPWVVHQQVIRVLATGAQKFTP